MKGSKAKPARQRWSGRYDPMLTVVSDSADRDGSAAMPSSVIDEIVREGARRMLAEALRAEVDAYIGQFADVRDEKGHRLVVRNGCHEPREVLTSAGCVPVTVPRVNDKRVDPDTGERQRFSSSILPPWARKTPRMAEVLPLLYLHGLSSGDFVPALGQFLGSAKGLSSSTVTKLTETWQGEQRAFAERDLSGVDYVYLWADGIHVNIRLEEDKLCLLVMIGVRADGRKELIALADGYRESAGSWADLLRDCKRRGMRAPVLAAGSGVRCARCSRRPVSSVAGFIRSRISLLRCRSRHIPGRRRRLRRSGMPRTSPMPVTR
jgi:transposase-like protein